MSKEVTKLDANEYGLQENQAKEIENAFLPKIKEREGYVNIYDQIIKKEINEETCEEARELRLKLVKVRTGIASIHKSQKSYFLAAGKFVDAWKNKETLPVTQMEENLTKIEKHFENIEKERIAKLNNERSEQLRKYCNEEDVLPSNLGEMERSMFDVYLSGMKKKHEDKIEAEKKAEAERIAKEKAEAEERERIRKENEKLKKEAEERERLAKIEADKRAKEEAERKAKEEAERKKREEKERIEREAYEAKLKAEREERERVEREERLKREKLEAELKAKEEAERKEKEAEEARLQAELNKGDADKVKDLINDLELLKTKYSFKSSKNRKMYSDVNNLLDKVINHIK